MSVEFVVQSDVFFEYFIGCDAFIHMCYIMSLFNLYGTSDSRWNRFWTSKSSTVNLVSRILLEERLLYILIFCTLKRYKNIFFFFVTAAGQDVIIKYQRCSYIIPSPLSKRFCINFGVEIFKRMIDYNILYFYIRKNYNIYTYMQVDVGPRGKLGGICVFLVQPQAYLFFICWISVKIQ